MPGSPTASLDQLDHGHHACAAFTADAEREELAVDFVRDGLRAGDRVWYFADARTPEQVISGLRRGAVPGLDAALERGQLVVVASSDSYLSELPFEPEGRVAALDAAVDDALADGWTGFRVTGEMCWAARDVPGAERVEAYEQAVNAVFAGRPAAALCLYDRRRFSERRLPGLLGAHPHRMRLPAVTPGGTLRIARRGDGWLRVAGEADLAGDDLLAAALAGATADELHVDLAGTRFVDLAGATRLVRAAAGRRVVLHDPPPGLRRMLELLWPGHAAVEVV